MNTLLNLLTTFVILKSNCLVEGDRDLFIYCGACLSMVEEFGWHMAATSDKTKIDVGSFRIDEKGNTGAQQVPWKRSEIQMIELVEGICGTMYDYHMYTDPGTGRKSFIRTTGRTGEKLSLKNIMISEYITKDLQFACDTIVEEHEDSLIKLFQENEKEIGEKFCVEVAGVCTAHEVKEQRMHTAHAVMQGMQELMPGMFDDGKFATGGNTAQDEDGYDDDDDDEYCDEDDEDCEYIECDEDDDDCEEDDVESDDDHDDDECDENDDDCEYVDCDEDDDDCELYDDDDEEEENYIQCDAEDEDCDVGVLNADNGDSGRGKDDSIVVDITNRKNNTSSH